MSNRRRSIDELIEKLIDLIVDSDVPLKLNDIAVSLGSNTKVVQRWLQKIIYVQNASKIIVTDYYNNKYIIALNRHKYGFKIYFQSDICDIDYWIKSPYNLTDGYWIPTEMLNDADLVLINFKNYSITDNYFKEIIKYPIMGCEVSLNRQNAYYYVLGYKIEKIFDNIQLHTSMQTLRILGGNLISGIRNKEYKSLFELIPLFLPKSCIPSLQEKYNKEDVFEFANNIGVIILTTFDTDFEHIGQFWRYVLENPNLVDYLKLTNLGMYVYFAMHYFLGIDVDIEMVPNENELYMHHLWYFASLSRQIEFSKEHRYLLDKLLDKYIEFEDTKAIFALIKHNLYDNLSIKYKELVIREYNNKNRFPYTAFDIFVELSKQISSQNNFSYVKIGWLHSFYNSLDEQIYPFIRFYILNFMNSYMIKFKVQNNVFIYNEILHLQLYNSHMRLFKRVINLIIWNLKNHNITEIYYLTNLLISRYIGTQQANTIYDTYAKLNFLFIERIFGNFQYTTEIFGNLDIKKPINDFIQNLYNFIYGLDIKKICCKEKKNELFPLNTMKLNRYNDLLFLSYYPEITNSMDSIDILVILPYPEFMITISNMYSNRRIGIKEKEISNIKSDDEAINIIIKLKTLLITKEKFENPFFIRNVITMCDTLEDYKFKKILIYELLIKTKKYTSITRKEEHEINMYRQEIRLKYYNETFSGKLAHIKLYLSLIDWDKMLISKYWNKFLLDVFPDIKLTDTNIHPLNLLHYLLIRAYILWENIL